ncbi:MAG TPA: amidase [Burkholderiales bacterium]|nr:amidase [Burkholderiales bacterium]
MKDLNTLGAVEAAKLIAAKKLNAEKLTRACLERIAAREADVRAWEHLDPDYAIEQARQIDRGPDRGLLHGLPIGVKDLFDTADMPSCYGSPIYTGHRPVADAASVAVARSAGAVIIGKTVTTEFAMFNPGKTANPRNPAHTPGGSSSGSAAAVADCMVPFAFGTQTAGSIIRPAAYCGVVGYKPSFGTVSRAGVKLLSDNLDTVGVLARNVPDAALFVAALSGRVNLMIGKPLAKPPRIGLCRTYEWEQAQPEAQAALEEAAHTLARGGAKVIDVTLPVRFAGLVAAHMDVLNFDGARALAYEWICHRERLSPRLAEVLQAGMQCSAQRFDASLATARGCRDMLDEVFADCDVLIAPSAPGEAPAGLESTGNPLFNRIWTLLHVPCVHVPFATGPNGLPVGVQVIGPVRSDAETLAIADWAHRHLA